jgi:hypothetical protein
MVMSYSAGILRYLRAEGVEVLRQICVAVRDPAWGTVPARISHETIDQGPDWFQIRLAAHHYNGEIDFHWTGHIKGTADGSVHYMMSGEAGASFWKNRIGICVLHPIEGYAGAACRIVHTSGTVEETRFPLLISPQQPFYDVRAIHSELKPGLTVQVEFRGDIFETEDHRNWTDDSFKTYSTPLRVPFPARMESGSRVEQSVTVRTQGMTRAEPGNGPVRFEICEEIAAPFPVMRKRLDLHLDSPSLLADLRSYSAAGPAEYALFTDGSQAHFQRLREALEEFRPEVERWLIFDSTGVQSQAGAVRTARQVLGTLYPGIPIGGGANRNFAELNRNRELVADLDFVNWGIDPQVHAIDDETLVENLRGQRATVETARSFAGNRPLSVSPVMLRAHDATQDAREYSAFGAAWAVGSLKHLAEARVGSITYRHLSAAESLWKAVSAFAPTGVQVSRSSHPLTADGVVLVAGSRRRLLLANFLGIEQEVAIAGVGSVRLLPHGVEAIEMEGN